MASISLPPQSQPTMFSQHLEPADRPVSGTHRRNVSANALPIPPFVFPARNPDDAPSEPPASTQPTSSALPAFSFNPGAAHTGQPSLSVPSPNRAGGHRRRPSELIGGDQLVTPETTETSHSNDENSMPRPAHLPPPGPGFSKGNARRGHAHRRSAAVSSVDLTAIRHALDLKPALGSAPCTPADVNQSSGAQDKIVRPRSLSATVDLHTPPASPPLPNGGSSPYNARIGTPGSAVAVEAPASPEIEKSVPVAQPEQSPRNSEPLLTTETTPLANRKSRARPKTADASLMFNLTGMESGPDGSPSKRPLSAAGHTRRKSMSAGILDAALRKKNHSSDQTHLADASRPSSSDDGSDTSTENHADQSDPAKKKSKSKKKKKVRSWAGSILTRTKSKGKRKAKKNDPEEPLPPVLTRTNSELGSGLDVDFDDDNIVVLRTPTNPNTPETKQSTSEPDPEPSFESSWKPRSFYEQGTQAPQGPREDALSPVIDLDAALGPFNTPDLRTDNNVGSGFSAATRRMYSGGRRGEFIGPEMRYHRRTESAPEMPPFDRSALTANRLSTHTSAENPDVFDEEEEDAFLAATSESPKDGEELPPSKDSPSSSDKTDTQSATSKDSSDTLTRQPVEDEAKPQNAGLGIRRNAAAQLSVARSSWEAAKASLQKDAVDQVHNAKNPFSGPPKTPVEVIKHEEWQHKVPVPPSPDVSPRFLPADKRPATSPLEDVPPLSLHNGSSLPNSSFPSPDFHGSPEAPRSITTSSTNDRNFSNPSSSYNNMSIDYPHTSIEDVPSLTSSASTMTNKMNRFSSTFFARRGSNDRSASFSAAVHRRTSNTHAQKRSSLASLSKLMVGPHAEKSKLSYEEKPPGDTPEKSKKKGRRLSRLMHFWRINQKDKLNDNTVQEKRP